MPDDKPADKPDVRGVIAIIRGWGCATPEEDQSVQTAAERACYEAQEAVLLRVPCQRCGGTVGHQGDGKRVCGCSISTIQCARCRELAAVRARLAE